MMRPVFSLNFKVQSVLEQLSTPAGRAEALDRLRPLPLTGVWLETYRTGERVSPVLLRELKTFFHRAGYRTGACVVPTSLSERRSNSWADTCHSDPTVLEHLSREAGQAAAIFDQIIWDDFFFASCSCPFCEAERGSRSWQQYRSDKMRALAAQAVLSHPGKHWLKYPCWYEHYANGGYDLEWGPKLFSGVWIGTETRNPEEEAAGRVPQTQGCFLQQYLNLTGRCGGGWYDALSCSPETFVEQARNTILGGARESFLHCYDYLYPTPATLARDGGRLTLPRDQSAIQAFQAESAGLLQLGEHLAGQHPRGLDAVKIANEDENGPDAGCHALLAFAGLPIRAAARLTPGRSAILSAHVLHDPGLEKFLASGTPFAFTPDFKEKYGRRLPSGGWALPAPDTLRNQVPACRAALLQATGYAEFDAPAGVSQHYFDRSLVIQNFLNQPVEIVLRQSAARRLRLALPTAERAAWDATAGRLCLNARSLALLE